ncbi:MAG: hypothetical protein HQ542_08175 [Bacteroidia bacterium]|nr:hypothetical protein [Bacteroidia bacterium]
MKKVTMKLLVTLMLIAAANVPLLVSGQSTTDYDVCQGVTETYWIATPGVGSTFAWTITPGVSGTDWLITANNNDTIDVQWILPGVYTVLVLETSAEGCVGDSVTVDVTVIEQPTVANAGPDSTLCGTLAFVMEGNTATVGTGTWSQFSGPGMITFNDPNNPTTSITASDYGTYILVWNIANGVCPATTDSVTITFNPPITVTASSNTPVCEGDTLELYCDYAGATYAWSGPGGFTSTDQNPVIPNATPANSGTYTVIVSNIPGGCPDATDSTDVVVNPKPITNGIWHN